MSLSKCDLRLVLAISQPVCMKNVINAGTEKLKLSLSLSGYSLGLGIFSVVHAGI